MAPAPCSVALLALLLAGLLGVARAYRVRRQEPRAHGDGGDDDDDDRRPSALLEEGQAFSPRLGALVGPALAATASTAFAPPLRPAKQAAVIGGAPRAAVAPALDPRAPAGPLRYKSLDAAEEEAVAPQKAVCDHMEGRARASEAGLNRLLQEIFPALVDRQAALSFPDIRGERRGWVWELSVHTIARYALDIPTAELKEGASVSFKITNFSIDLELPYSVEGTRWYSGVRTKGRVRAELALVDEINAIVVVAAPSPERKPQLRLDLGDVRFALADFAADGSVFSGLLEVFVSAFRTEAERRISRGAKQIVEEAVNIYLNGFLRDGFLQNGLSYHYAMRPSPDKLEED